METEQLIKAKNYILYLLSYRQYSKYEIQQKLKKKKYTISVIKQAISDLERVELINDRKFAEMWIDTRMRLKPKGKTALWQELREKGIDKSIIDSVLSNFEEKYDEFLIAKKLAQKRLKSYKNIDLEKSKQRIYNFLRRRGFSYETINEVLEGLYN